MPENVTDDEQTLIPAMDWGHINWVIVKYSFYFSTKMNIW